MEILKSKKKILFFLLIITGVCLYRCQGSSLETGLTNSDYAASKNTSLGIWVTVFSEKKVLYSKEAAAGLITFCKEAKINAIYLQVYRAGLAYYNSKISDRAKYEEIVNSAGTDTIEFLLNEAHKNKIKVFAWMNILSLAQNKNAHIIAKLGKSILTRDQYCRVSLRTESINETDKYYLRDDQLFLEPGDPKVVEYLLSVITEFIKRYPSIDGVHLDYIRYPYPVPFIPDSRFNKYGLTYGYGKKNIERFIEKTGFNPLSKEIKNDTFLLWDNWKRRQITDLAAKISSAIRINSPEKLISCAVIPSLERAYNTAFQDWALWLEQNIVDYVVLMNYTRDQRLAQETAASALAHRAKGKIFIGIGAYLMKNDTDLLSKQYKLIKKLNPDGIVFFQYDDIAGNNILKKN